MNRDLALKLLVGSLQGVVVCLQASVFFLQTGDLWCPCLLLGRFRAACVLLLCCRCGACHTTTEEQAGSRSVA